MPHHGDIDKDKKKVYCGYWMTIEEWEYIHNYSIHEKFNDSDLKQNILQKSERQIFNIFYKCRNYS